MWNFEAYGDHPALIEEGGGTLSYGQLKTAGDELAAVIGKRCLILQLCENSIGSVIGYTSFIRHDSVPIMLDADVRPELLLSYLELYKPEFIYLPESLEPSLNGQCVYRRHGYSLIKTDCGEPFSLNEELALLITTSGSTGSPKLVRQSLKNLKANTSSIVEYLGLDSSSRAVSILPMNYSYGISVLNTHLCVGATMLLTQGTLMQRQFWDFVVKERASYFAGVPYTFEMLDRLRFERRDLPFLKIMTVAGGKLQPRLHEKFARLAEDRGFKFFVMYGQSEATARMGFLPPDLALKKVGAMGKAIPGGEFRLEGPDGQVITALGVNGELVYRGVNVSLGYAESGADLCKGDEFGGVLHTGDIACRDEDGIYTVTGRLKRFLKIFGNRLNLDETERLLKEKFPDVGIACCGHDDRMTVFITNNTLCDEVSAWLSAVTHLNSTAFAVRYMDSLPKNKAGKILYGELPDT